MDTKTYANEAKAVHTYNSRNWLILISNRKSDDTLTETNSGITTIYTWNLLNRITQWQKTGETTQAYVYNADGLRVRVTPSGGTATEFLLDLMEVAEEVTGANVISCVAPGVISEISGTTRTVYHADGIGSTRAISDASQAATVSTIYDAYGNLVAAYPSGAPEFGYAGWYRYYADSTGLAYLKHRYYDPVVGRFLSRDPVGYEAGLNMYEYVSGAPTTAVDPNGTSEYHILPYYPKPLSCPPGMYCLNNADPCANPPDNRDWVDKASDFFAGWGDQLTFGGTGLIRNWIGVGDVVDTGSGW